MAMKALEMNFPSLKLGYEQVNDALKDQVEAVRDYESRAITLFSVAVAVLGIGMPLLLTKAVSQSLCWLTASLIPIVLFVFRKARYRCAAARLFPCRYWHPDWTISKLLRPFPLSLSKRESPPGLGGLSVSRDIAR